MRKYLLFVGIASVWLMSCAPAQAPNVPTTAPVNTAAPAAAATATALPATATPLAPTATAVRPTSAPTTAPQASATQCNHPFYPVSATAKWQYRVTTTGLAPSTFTQTDTNVTANSFTEHREFANLKVDNGWTCGSDGALMSNQFGNLSFSQSQFKLETTKNTGVTFAAPKDWKVGTTWNNAFEVKGTATTANTTTNVTGTIDIAYKIVAQESVTVPAGTYNAFKVESNAAMKLSMTVGASTVPFSLTFTGTSWFAQNVGIVKTQSLTQGIEGTTELLSFTP